MTPADDKENAVSSSPAVNTKKGLAFVTAAASPIQKPATPKNRIGLSFINGSPTAVQKQTTPVQKRQRFTAAKFQPPTTIDFGTVEYTEGCSVEQTFDIVNPGFTAMTLSVSKFPFTKGFAMSWVNDDDEVETVNDKESSLYIDGNEDAAVTIKWSPLAGGHMRETVTLSDGNHRFTLKFVGQAHLKTPKKSFKSKALPKTNAKGYKYKAPPPGANKKVGGSGGGGGGGGAAIKFLVNRKEKMAPCKNRRLSCGKVQSPKKKAFLKRKSTFIKLAKKGPGSSMAPDSSAPIRRLKLLGATPGASSPLRSGSKSRSAIDDSCSGKQERCFTRWLNHVLAPQSASSSDNAATTKASYATTRKQLQIQSKFVAIMASEGFQETLAKVDEEIDAGKIAVRDDRSPREDAGLRDTFVKAMLSYSSDWLKAGLEAVCNELVEPAATTMTKPACAHLSDFIAKKLLFNETLAEQYRHPSVPNCFKAGFEEANKVAMLKRFLRLVLVLDQAKEAEVLEGRPCLFNTTSDVKDSRGILNMFCKEMLKGEGDFCKHLNMLGYAPNQKTQTKLDEYDFKVENLATDLTDGVRLTRLAEVLSGDLSLSKGLRLPANTKMQMEHNISIAIKSFKALGCSTGVFPKAIAMGNREQTMVLMWQVLMKTHVDTAINVEKLSAEIKTLKSRDAYKNSAVRASIRRKSKESNYAHSERLNLLLEWVQAVCTGYEVEVNNFTASFSDGRALLYLIHHYCPHLLKRSAIADVTTMNNVKEDEKVKEISDKGAIGWTGAFSPGIGKVGGRSRFQQLNNERANFRLLANTVKQIGAIPILAFSSDMSDTIPDEKVVITYATYMCSRLLDLRLDDRAAHIIQAAWRAMQSRLSFRAALQTLLAERTATQAATQAAAARQQQIQVFRQTAATIRIQAWFRGQQQRNMYTAMVNAAIVIQNAWRDALVVRELAAATIQSKFRTFVAKSERTRLAANLGHMEHILAANAQDHAAIVIQRHVRHFLCRRQEERAIAVAAEKVLAKQTSAAIVLQSVYRGYVARAAYTKTRASIITAQAIVRGYIARKAFAVMVDAKANKEAADMLFATQSAAATTMQSVYRGYVARTAYITTRASIITVQAVARGWLARKHVLNMDIAAMAIQSTFRLYTANCERERLEGNMIALEKIVYDNNQEQAACTIQRSVRLFLARRQEERTVAAAVTEFSAATTIQSMCRGYIARTAYNKTRASIITAQAIVRGYIARKAFAVMVDAKAAKEAAAAFLVVQTTAATTVQSAYRGYIARKVFATMVEAKAAADLMEKQMAAATTIQSVYRGYSAQSKYSATRASIITAQAIVRGYIARKQYAGMVEAKATKEAAAALFAKQTTAATTMQSAYRGYIARTAYNSTRASIITAQAIVRGYIARKQYASMVEAKATKEAADMLFATQSAAATTMQSVYRGYVARTAYNKTRASIITVQAVARGWFARKEFAAMIDANVAAKAAADLVIKQTCAATTMQSVYRGYIARKAFATMVEAKQAAADLMEKQMAAATTIQSVYRGYSAQSKYTATRASIITAQAIVRGYIARKQYAGMVEAKATKEAAAALFAKQTTAATTVQSAYRGYIARKVFATMVEAKAAADFLIKQTNAALTIQSIWRGCIARKDYATMVEAKAAVDLYIKQSSAATTVQSAYRGYIARKEFAAMIEAKAAALFVVKQLSAATVMQSAWRGRMARVEYNRIRAAVITIQAYTRGYIVRKQFPKTMPVNMAATMIQSAWRGFITRKRSSKKAQRLAARIAAANACAEEHMTLGARTVSALKILLTHKQLTFVLRACENLVVATKLSTGCCTRMVDAKAVPIIFQLVRSCNRSKPHMAVLVVALEIMLNLVKCDATSKYVFQEGEAIGLMSELCQMYRDKTEIFAVVLEIMGNFTNDAEKVATIKKRVADMKRFDQIKSLLERKAKLSKKIDLTRARKAAKPGAKGTKKKKGAAAEKAPATISTCLDTLTQFVSTIKA